MTAADLMRAVVPVFPPSEADVVRGGYLKGELVTSDLHCPPSEFFMLFDTDNDGLISFPEGIDKEEFKKVMSHHAYSKQTRRFPQRRKENRTKSFGFCGERWSSRVLLEKMEINALDTTDSFNS
ncbi:hypothetical protein DH2020_010806 [Rehmannia glutinosa]|uniref:EF-hand domain-containing protein n=1 Tax=Rehmannia glutinosa TaxID=99300 RepID=A0ABR0XBM1_REHGL